MLKSVIQHIKKNCKNLILKAGVVAEEAYITVKKENLLELLKFLKADAECKFSMLISICGVDYPSRTQRFEVIYNLLSIENNLRLCVKVSLSENEIVPSVISLYSCAGWYERETWDMYGIMFSGNPDLRRLLTDYGFEGHPLRKDFALTGYTEVTYDHRRKKVVQTPVHLAQEFRNFDTLSPWEGNNILPGDEKATK